MSRSPRSFRGGSSARNSKTDHSGVELGIDAGVINVVRAHERALDSSQTHTLSHSALTTRMRSNSNELSGFTLSLYDGVNLRIVTRR